MDKLIQEIIDGDHEIVDDDFVNYPELGRYIDVMEIAVWENPNFIKYAKLKISKNDKEKGIIDLYEYALEHGYVPNGKDIDNNNELLEHECIYNRCIQELEKIMEELNNGRVLNDDEFLNYYTMFKYLLTDLRNDFFKLAIEYNSNLIKHLKISPLFSGRDKLLYINGLVAKAIACGYVPNENDFQENASLGYSYIIIKKAIDIDYNLIRYSKLDPNRSTFLTKELVFDNQDLYKKAIEMGYIPTEDDLKDNYYLSSSYHVMMRAIEVNYRLFRYSRNYDDNLAFEAIRRGYVITKNDIENNPFLLKFHILAKQAIDIDPNYILKCSDYDYFDVNLVKYAISKGFIPNSEEIGKKYAWFGNNDIMKMLIEMNPKFVEIAEDFDNLFYFAIEKGYSVTFEDIKGKKDLLYSDVLFDYLMKNDPMLYNNDFLNEYIDRDSLKGLDLFIINDIWSFICNNEVYHNMGYNNMLTIVKYIYCNDDIDNNLKKKFIQLASSDKMVEFNRVLDILMNENNDSKERLRLMIDIYDNYIKYHDLCCYFLEHGGNEKDRYLLRKLLLSKDEINLEISTIDDLAKYDEILYQSRKKEIINPDNGYYDYALGEYDIEVYYNQILLMLINMDYATYLSEVENGFSLGHITVLQNSIKNSKCKDELENYKKIIRFIESILKIEDAKKLKTFALRLNEAIYKNSEAVLNIYEVLRNISKIKNYYYGVEIEEKMLDINTLMPTYDNTNLPYIRENGKFTCPDVKIFGENLEGRKVDYIEFNGIDFTLFVHVLNAYGNGATLEDFKRNRLVGKTYICLSPITDENYHGFVQKKYIDDDDEFSTKSELELQIEKANNVKLIFSKFTPDQLIAMGNEDIAAYAKKNSLDVKAFADRNYAPIRDNVRSLSYGNYCEYDFYRDSNNGEQIYPTAILCMENEPSVAEKIAAAYLQIPILHINNTYKKKKVVSNTIQSELRGSEQEEKYKKQLLEIKKILISGIEKSNATTISDKERK